MYARPMYSAPRNGKAILIKRAIYQYNATASTHVLVGYKWVEASWRKDITGRESFCELIFEGATPNQHSIREDINIDEALAWADIPTEKPEPTGKPVAIRYAFDGESYSYADGSLLTNAEFVQGTELLYGGYEELYLGTQVSEINRATDKMIQALKMTRDWWLNEGMKHYTLAPACFFAVREALGEHLGGDVKIKQPVRKRYSDTIDARPGFEEYQKQSDKLDVINDMFPTPYEESELIANLLRKDPVLISSEAEAKLYLYKHGILVTTYGAKTYDKLIDELNNVMKTIRHKKGTEE